MDKNRIEGAAKDVKGSIKKGVGDMTGDRDMQAEGQADKAEGKIQKGVGNAKDAAKDALP